MPCWRSSHVALAGMAREHPLLGLEDLGHVDVEVDRHGPTLGVSAFKGST